METEPLTKAERAWLKKLEKLFMNPPTERIGFYSVGDADLGVFDNRKIDKIHSIMDSTNCDFGTCVVQAGASINASVKTGTEVHSVAG